MFECAKISKTYENGIHSLKDVSLKIENGQSVVLYGPSGAGKSTLLKILTGLEQPDSGQLLCDGRPCPSFQQEGSTVTMVFQKPMILDSCTTRENIEYGMDRRRYSRKERKEKTERAAALARCTSFLDQLGGELSGGQQQRTAIARAIVCDPDLLCLDEPFSALDPALRDVLLEEVLKLKDELGFALVFVTHNFLEMELAGGTVCYMRDGRIIQQGSVEDIYYHPVDVETARSFGTPGMNILPAPEGFLGFYPASVSEEELPEALELDGLQTEKSLISHGQYLNEVRYGEQRLRVQTPKPFTGRRLWVPRSEIVCFDAAGRRL